MNFREVMFAVLYLPDVERLAGEAKSFDKELGKKMERVAEAIGAAKSHVKSRLEK